jgi:hypothetical protein
MQHGGIGHNGLDAQMVDLRRMGRLSVIASDHMGAAGSLRSDADRSHRSRFPERSPLGATMARLRLGDHTIAGRSNWRFLSPSRRLLLGGGPESHPRRNNSEHGNQKQRRDRASHGTPPFTQGMDVTTERAARKCGRSASRRKPAGESYGVAPLGRRRRTRPRMRRAKPGNQRPKGSAARSQSSSRSTRNSAAERAGLKPGDLVTELDGTPSAGNAWSCGPFGAAGPAAAGTRRLAGPRREAQDELGCGEMPPVLEKRPPVLSR